MFDYCTVVILVRSASILWRTISAKNQSRVSTFNVDWGGGGERQLSSSNSDIIPAVTEASMRGLALLLLVIIAQAEE